MNLLKPSTLEESIVRLLEGGEKSTHILLEELQSKRVGTTKQGFYAALRKLKTAEVVVVYKKIAALNTAWVREMRTTIEKMGEAYIGNAASPDLFSLEEKESISYVFSTTRHLDIFWGHAQNILVHHTPPSEAVYAYDPHYWFYIARKETEERLLREITALGKQFLMTAGGSTPLDKIIRSDFKGEIMQYHLERIFEKNNYYVTVIGDYITEVTIDSNIAEKIEKIYTDATVLTPVVTEELARILEKKAKNKIRITRNKTKARRLKARLGKNFFVRKTN